MIRVTLVTGQRAAMREAAIASAISRDREVALILEGLPDGTAPLFEDGPHLTQVRIAAGCLCCIGNLTLRVTLNRLLRQKPQDIYISLANDAHLEQLEEFLRSPPYNDLLRLTETLTV